MSEKRLKLCPHCRPRKDDYYHKHCANLIKDLKCGLGETKPYYCKGDYIWSDENGNITSKSRQEFEKRDKRKPYNKKIS